MRDENDLTLENIKMTVNTLKIILLLIENSNFQDFAFSGIAKGTNSQRQYFDDMNWAN